VAWENRRGGRFYYRARRAGGRVVKAYVGTGPLAAAMADLDGLERTQRLADEREAFDAVERASAAEEPLGSLCGALDALVADALRRAGYHRHNRGEWRRRRHGRT
jgi:hypothetical protein